MLRRQPRTFSPDPKAFSTRAIYLSVLSGPDESCRAIEAAGSDHDVRLSDRAAVAIGVALRSAVAVGVSSVAFIRFAQRACWPSLRLLLNRGVDAWRFTLGQARLDLEGKDHAMEECKERIRELNEEVRSVRAVLG